MTTRSVSFVHSLRRELPSSPCSAAAYAKDLLPSISPDEGEKASRVSEVILEDYWNVPFDPPSSYTGRDEIFAHIKHELLKQNSRTGNKIFVVYGIAGSGKTSLCLKLAWELRPRFPLVIWIDSCSTISIKLALRQLAQKLKQADDYRVAIDYLSNSRTPWLLVFDNADDPALDLSAFFPTNELGHILITSRNPQSANLSTVGRQKLGALEEHEACDLLLKSLQQELPAPAQICEEACMVVKAVGFLPLAVVHAATDLSQGLCEMREYPQRLEKQQSKLLSSSLSQGSARYPQTIYDTLERSMEYIENLPTQSARDACELLRFLAFLHYDEISENIIRNAWENAQTEYRRGRRLRSPIIGLVRSTGSAAQDYSQQNEWDRDATRKAFNVLASCSIITKTSPSAFDNMSIHPVIHMWIRERMDLPRRLEAFLSAYGTMRLSIRWSFGEKNKYEYQRYILPHLWRLIDEGKDIVLQMAEEDPKLLDQVSELY